MRKLSDRVSGPSSRLPGLRLGPISNARSGRGTDVRCSARHAVRISPTTTIERATLRRLDVAQPKQRPSTRGGGRLTLSFAAIDHAQDVVFAHDNVFGSLDLDCGAGVFSEQDPVSDLHV